jgi:ferrochelatase
VAEALAGLDGRDVVALSLSPYTSRLTTDGYKKALAEAGRAAVPLIEGWSADPQYLQAISEHVARALDGRQSSDYALLFTAHNVPEETILGGDPYVEEIQHTIAQLVPVIMPGDWRLGWQSKGRRDDARWLEPEVEDVVLQFAAQGWQKLLVVPVGFLCDNVETLYDLDLVLRKVVEGAGMHYLRSEPANDSPRCIEALADAVADHLAMRPAPDQSRPAAG